MEALTRFSENPKIKTWYNGAAPELKESTRKQYTIFLMRYLGEEEPADFVKRAEQDPKAVAIEIKGRIGEIYGKSQTTAKQTKYAIKSLLDYYQVELHVNGKMKVRRVRKKVELKWSDA